MTREWRSGSIHLVNGYTLTLPGGEVGSEAHDVRFALEGGFVNIQIPGVPGTQVISAPAVRRIVCDSLPD